jgi:hypothetical protein
MKLDKAFEFAVILAWEDLIKVATPSLVRVEYVCEPGVSLDSLSVWSVKAGGEQDLVCDYWTWTSAAHPSGMRFRNGHHSDQLAQSLEFIMKNQDQFTRAADTCRHGLALIYPPTGAERTEAATWMRRGPGTATNFGAAANEGVPPPLPLMATRPQGSQSL